MGGQDIKKGWWFTMVLAMAAAFEETCEQRNNKIFVVVMSFIRFQSKCARF